ncbi:hypothetical protein TASIC1_0013001200 [Trichoderma asperellum]|uniref:Uncharacterized protein n=1 Tax=Trichoderma asperellum TaxID=101201 RepID=A0A6V8R2R5_TRIAP|nr:hypothetical protein TASIC1_0013001200 [Trichoderma asperellum]
MAVRDYPTLSGCPGESLYFAQDTSADEAWRLGIAIDMRRCSEQEAVLLDMASGLGPLDPRLVAAGHESRIEGALQREALDKDAWLAAAAAASIVLEGKELEAPKQSAGPDSCH